jgi:NADH-quinone oxidoreductase subunit I
MMSSNESKKLEEGLMDIGPESPGVVLAPELRRLGVFGSLVSAIVSLAKGMKVTLSYLLRPSTVVTQQYPENRETLKMAERFRSQLTFVHDENGLHKCTACHICEEACPNASIKVVERKGATGRAELDYFVWRMDSCTFCNMCVMVCPFSVLKMDGRFESSVYDQRLLIFNLNKHAGPSATALAKITDSEERNKQITPRIPYSGPIPLGGTQFVGVKGEPE